MKLYQVIMVAVLSTTVLYGSVAAEYQDDKLFGNGRFLRRVRNDITGKSQPKPNEKTKPSKKEKEDPRAKQPTPATKRPTGKFPTPAVRPGTAPVPSARPVPAARPIPTARPTAARTITPPSRQSNPTPATARISDSDQSDLDRSTAKSTLGFGMLLEEKSDEFMVTQIDPKGNAHEAGIKRGDVILEAGGIKLGSMEEFSEITKILGEGDQLEFKVERRGKTKDILIQFGKAPEGSDVADSYETKKENDYSFVPEQDDNPQAGLRSVLDQPQRSVNQTARPNQVARNPNQNKQLTIEQQRQQIEQMQQEIERLRRQSQLAPANGKPANDGLILDGPGFSGPGN